MRKLMLAAAALAALAVAGLAYAHARGGSVTQVTGTFTATTVSHSRQQTCTTSDGKTTLQRTEATYTGTAAGDAAFAGAVTIQARSTIDTSSDLGVVQGRIRFGSEGGSQAQFTAVYDHGAVAGLAVGHGDKSKHGALLANVSAGFSAAGGFTGGKLGSSAGGSAVLLSPGTCSSSDSTGSKDDGKDKSTSQASARGSHR